MPQQFDSASLSEQLAGLTEAPKEAIVEHFREMPVLHEERREFAAKWAHKFSLLLPSAFFAVEGGAS